MKRINAGTVLAVITLVCALWVTSALAIPNYILSGYSNTFTVSDGTDSYGTFSVLFTGGTADATGTQVSGLSGFLKFTQDPTDTVLLPNGTNTFSGLFADSFILNYANGFLDLTTDLGNTSMLSMNVGLGFNLLALTAAPIDLTFAIPTGQETITGTIGTDPSSALLVDFITDELAYSAVPEPSSFLLIGAGLAGLAFWRRRKSS